MAWPISLAAFQIFRFSFTAQQMNTDGTDFCFQLSQFLFRFSAFPRTLIRHADDNTNIPFDQAWAIITASEGGRNARTIRPLRIAEIECAALVRVSVPPESTLRWPESVQASTTRLFARSGEVEAELVHLNANAGRADLRLQIPLHHRTSAKPRSPAVGSRQAINGRFVVIEELIRITPLGAFPWK